MSVESELQMGTTGLDAAPDSATEHVYVFPVTFAQQRLLFLNQLDPSSTSYSVPWSIRITGPLNAAALERSLNEIVQRHEILRTTYDIVEGHPVQTVSPAEHVPLVLVDLSSLPDGEREAQNAAMTEAQLPLDLKNGPMVRTKLVRLGDNDHVLLVTTHHIAFDGWSRRVLVSELATLYEAFCAGQPSPLPELPLQYADYAVWQRNFLQGENLDKLLTYWRQNLAGAPTMLDLPTDRPRPAVQSFRGTSKSFVLPGELSERVTQISRQLGVTTFMTMLAAFQALLSRYTGQQDILVGTPIANRNRAEVEGLIGLFANLLPLRVRFDGDPTFRELLARVKETALGAYAHQEMPFERLVEELRPERSLSYNPLFQVMFSLQNAPRRAFQLSGLELKPLGGVIGTTAKFDLSVFLLENEDGRSGRIEYNTEIFDAETIQRMLRHYMVLLEGAVANPATKVSQLPLLTEDERQKILIEWNATQADYPRDSCLHVLISQQAKRTPERIAVVSGNQQLTYGELDRRSNQLARYLQKRGVAPEVLVGMMVSRTTNLLVAILGVLKAGGAYVPLDPIYPKDRISNILANAEVPIVLTQRSIADELASFHGRQVLIDAEWPSIAKESTDDVETPVGPSNLAYVLFTSGSTGKPKGVAIEHHSASTLIHWAQGVFSSEELAGVLFSTSICFDLSVFEMFVPLSIGGGVVMADNALQLATLAARNQVTLINTVPSAMTELLRMDAVPESVQTVNLAGEALADSLVEQIYASTKVVSVYNLYGPTEDTTYSTFTLVPPGASVTIGRPIANSQAYILDAQRGPVPIGALGELYLAGDGLARGYYGRPELTNDRFVPNPFASEPGARMYCTGDLARFLSDGKIQYLGRIDHQIKLRGFRIELGEVESVLLSHPDVKACVVVLREDRPGDKMLVAYFVPKLGQSLDRSDLRNHLETTLPGYMVPGAFVQLDALPMTHNGKVNRPALPPPQASQMRSSQIAGPRDQLETTLVRIWERVLGMAPIGVDDNFFDLGGHSLLAVRLATEVETMVGRKLPLASLFRGSTVASLARMLREGTEGNPDPLIVEYQSGDPSVFPFFAVAAPGVRSLGYALLARHVGENHPFYKLQAQSPVVQGRPLRQVEAEELAKQHIAAMRAVQREGPYYLIAMCGGCQIAEQMILQLEAQGQTVGLFAIFDTWVLEHVHRRWGFQLFGIQQRFRWLRKASFRQKWEWVKDACVSRIRNWTGTTKTPTPWVDAYWPENFTPPRFRAPIVLFKRPKQLYFYINDPLLGWGARTAGGVEVHEVDADHHEVLREPHVQRISKILVARLGRTLTTETAPPAPAVSARVAPAAVATSH